MNFFLLSRPRLFMPRSFFFCFFLYFISRFHVLDCRYHPRFVFFFFFNFSYFKGYLLISFFFFTYILIFRNFFHVTMLSFDILFIVLPSSLPLFILSLIPLHFISILIFFLRFYHFSFAFTFHFNIVPLDPYCHHFVFQTFTFIHC